MLRAFLEHASPAWHLPLLGIWIMGTYVAPVLAWWLTLRGMRRLLGVALAIFGACVSGSIALEHYPPTGLEIVVWLAIGGLPFLASVMAIVVALGRWALQRVPKA